jgi:plastocyanin
MKSRATAVAVTGMMILSLSACDPAAQADMVVELTEFSITSPSSITASVDEIEVSNVGEFTHTVVITDSEGRVAAASGLIEPGETIRLDIDLAPGTYSFTCRIVAQDDAGNLIDHYESGMNATVEVEG